MARTGQSPSREERFWQWFEANTDRLLDIKDGQEPIVEELRTELQKIDRGLCFEVGPVREGRRAFIVSADGNKRAFPAVLGLTRAAPAMGDWKVISFRPPRASGSFGLRYRGIELSSEDVWFSAASDGRKIDLDLYLRGWSQEAEETVGAASLLLLDAALGEFVVETRVGAITRHSLPADPQGQGLRPFDDLPAAVSLPVMPPVSFPVAGEIPPERSQAGEATSTATWSLMKFERAGRPWLVGLSAYPHRAELDHEVLALIFFNASQENGMPASQEEFQAVLAIEEWIAGCLQRVPETVQALRLTGDGAREVYFYTSNPDRLIRLWQEELQPAIRSHQVAFYVRKDSAWEVHAHFRRSLEATSDAGPIPGLAQKVGQFLAASLAAVDGIALDNPSLALPVDLFAYGAVRGLAEGKGLSRLDLSLVAFRVACEHLGRSVEHATEVGRWIMDHEADESVQAVIAEGAEAVQDWQSAGEGTSRLAGLLAAIQDVADILDEGNEEKS